MPELSVASFNAHAGMDGWGRPYDLTEACRHLDADVIVLQEIFAPVGAISQADEVAAALDYTAVELPLARAWRRTEAIWQGKGWEPRKLLPPQQKALRVGGRVDLASSDLAGYEEGTWGLAVLSRVKVVTTEATQLGKLKRDFTKRGALRVDLEVPRADGYETVDRSESAGGGGTDDVRTPPVCLRTAGVASFTVVGTHAAHLTAGSPLQLRRLRTELPPTDRPAALAGDMNLWGPPASLMLPGWTRAVKGRTWPAWRPHSQPDHIFVTGAVTVLEGEVVRAGNSDHRGVRARLRW